jgi:hypothetical protein
LLVSSAAFRDSAVRPAPPRAVRPAPPRAAPRRPSRAVPRRPVPPRDIVQAHRYLEASEQVGKVVVLPA